MVEAAIEESSSKNGKTSQVVDLTVGNFEHLTQATTGATTGDWFVKFYAPWCGHCKTLAPIWEEVAEELASMGSSVNVAKVDVPKNENLSHRFSIKGFPTLLFLSKGKVYQFKGRRSKEELVEFALRGYALQEAKETPKEFDPYFGHIINTWNHASKEAIDDIKKAIKSGKIGDFFTQSTILIFMPVLFLFLLVLIIAWPLPKPRLPVDKTNRSKFPPKPNTEFTRNSVHVQPPSSSVDSANSEASTNDEAHDKKD